MFAAIPLLKPDGLEYPSRRATVTLVLGIVERRGTVVR